MILDIPSRSSRTEFYSTFPSDQLEGDTRLPIYCPIADFQRYLGQKLYWEKEHGHFTPLGCRVVGEGLARFIEKQQLLKHEEP
jgi:hypothetical protein